MTLTIRWLFAIITVICGIYVLIQSSGDKTTIAIGVGLISAGVGLVSP